ncbi:ABC transporter permease [Plantactinospora sp. S1510]|uniref:ABC transporter permease n=1 Tax=Plantactinospora alkalitolerans TaxID=2789879 RepID=A0ABS0GUY8_9ACTN|nr:ABC transporter permease [Plantactinospora alkalitolerans]MBF9129759.1 ABC transporter permease [Plantactinospora alkalitolerans]
MSRPSVPPGAPRSGRPRPPYAVAVLVAVGVVLLQSLLVPLFAGPAANLEPRDLPVVVAGPAPATDVLVRQLTATAPGAFEVIRLPDGTAADQALRDRDAYAAFVIGPDGPELHTASGAGPAVAALLTQSAGQLAGGQPPRVIDVVPADPDDPRGGGFAGGFLPLALTSMVAGVLLTLLVANRIARLAGLVSFGLLAGLAGPAVLQGWLGVLPGDHLTNGMAIGLIGLAIAATLNGLGAALGRAGLALGAVLVFLVGNPLSAVAAAPELLPQPWGTVGQWLPVGAGGTLLRSTAFFDGAGSATPLLILVGYAVVGLLLVTVGRARLFSPGSGPAAGSTASDAGNAEVAASRS